MHPGKTTRTSPSIRRKILLFSFLTVEAPRVILRENIQSGEDDLDAFHVQTTKCSGDIVFPEQCSPAGTDYTWMLCFHFSEIVVVQINHFAFPTLFSLSC